MAKIVRVKETDKPVLNEAKKEPTRVALKDLPEHLSRMRDTKAFAAWCESRNIVVVEEAEDEQSQARLDAVRANLTERRKAKKDEAVEKKEEKKVKKEAKEEPMVEEPELDEDMPALPDLEDLGMDFEDAEMGEDEEFPPLPGDEIEEESEEKEEKEHEGETEEEKEEHEASETPEEEKEEHEEKEEVEGEEKEEKEEIEEAKEEPKKASRLAELAAARRAYREAKAAYQTKLQECGIPCEGCGGGEDRVARNSSVHARKFPRRAMEGRHVPYGSIRREADEEADGPRVVLSPKLESKLREARRERFLEERRERRAAMLGESRTRRMNESREDRLERALREARERRAMRMEKAGAGFIGKPKPNAAGKHGFDHKIKPAPKVGPRLEARLREARLRRIERLLEARKTAKLEAAKKMKGEDAKMAPAPKVKK